MQARSMGAPVTRHRRNESPGSATQGPRSCQRAMLVFSGRQAWADVQEPRPRAQPCSCGRRCRCREDHDDAHQEVTRYAHNRCANLKQETKVLRMPQDPATGAPPRHDDLENQGEHRRHLIESRTVMLQYPDARQQRPTLAENVTLRYRVTASMDVGRP